MSNAFLAFSGTLPGTHLPSFQLPDVLLILELAYTPAVWVNPWASVAVIAFLLFMFLQKNVFGSVSMERSRDGLW